MCPLFHYADGFWNTISWDDAEVGTISKEKKQEVNEDIRASVVRVIDENGQMRGIMDIDDALALAEASNLDLVNISPNADPPVCKILDYGKYRYDLQKKDKQNKKNQKTTEIKEIRLSTFIEDHDLQVKANTAIKFLKGGDKLKVSLRFRGRERDYQDKGFAVMERFAEAVAEFGEVDKPAKLEGRNLNMFLSPKKDKK
ncbi:MAG: translation initiation factor IF-3 [Mogibacterium sp.]|nr:translation initiation factor IF-3 [Mogibacterium sp.]